MGLASRPTRTQRGIFLFEGAFERPVTKNSELAEVVFTAADFVPDSSESNRAKLLPFFNFVSINLSEAAPNGN